MQRTFPTPDPVTIRVKIPAGHVKFHAAAVQETRVDVEPRGNSDEPRVEMIDGKDGPTVVVESPEGWGMWRKHEYRVGIQCPLGSRIEVKTASADVEGSGRFGSLNATTASGDLSFSQVDGACKLVTASGDVKLEGCGPTEVKTASGDVAIGRTDGEIHATTASGDLRVGRTENSVRGLSASGDQTIEAVGSGSVWLETVSGDISVGVLPGVELWLDLQSLSGDTVSELPPTDGPGDGGPALELRLKSLSGDLRVHRADSHFAGTK